MFKLPHFFHRKSVPQMVAAVDLGSNSFHLIVARIAKDQVNILDRLKEMVRLSEGVDANNMLSDAGQERALACLARFGQRLRDMPVDSVRIVGTNTLRVAENTKPFLAQAEILLGHPIEIISGREEARLVYLGVAHTLANDSEDKRLVIDIGGGSTEFIIGKTFEPLQRESLTMGCVNITERFFSTGVLRPKMMRRAEIAALLELQPIEAAFRKTGWHSVIGTSGTLRAIERVIVEMGWGNEINFTSLQQLKHALLEFNHINQIKLKGLSIERTPVFIGGVAILLGIFEGLDIHSMKISDGALREGVIYDLLGRISHEDVRENTIENLSTRFLVDLQQAERVENTSLLLLSQVTTAWQLEDEKHAQMLSWAARLHEIGLSISHDQYHKHGEYLLTYLDLSGFSRQEQTLLATLVRLHRRKLNQDILGRTSMSSLHLLRLCILLRLAILLHRSRSTTELPQLTLQVTEKGLKLYFPSTWLEQHSLSQTDLELESDYLKDAKILLEFE